MLCTLLIMICQTKLKNMCIGKKIAVNFAHGYFFLGLAEQGELATLEERQALSTYMKTIISLVPSLKCWLMQGKWCQNGLDLEEEGVIDMG